MGDTTKETFKKEYDEFSSDEKLEVIKDTQERYILYIFLRKSGKQHNKFKVDLQNDFTIGDDRYPNNRQGNLILLEKWTKFSLIQQTTS